MSIQILSATLTGPMTIGTVSIPPDIRSDDNWWTAGSGVISWSGTAWQAVGTPSAAELLVINSGANDNWEIGYRPSNVTVTVNSGTGFIVTVAYIVTFLDTVAATLGSHQFNFNGANQESSFTIPLTFGSNDISKIDISVLSPPGDGWQIKNITFGFD